MQRGPIEKKKEIITEMAQMKHVSGKLRRLKRKLERMWTDLPRHTRMIGRIFIKFGMYVTSLLPTIVLFNFLQQLIPT
jgi:hypothetical protein